ncbi:MULTISPECIES: malonic semialdehyde reductase [Azorhizobium]|uniref:Putative NADH dehydrogenase/NAD(P)H nitroreductase AZC_4686 n=1 Tax=Azorhizobium caulinodans (strain ATCC 43989 / DSM 5975 / JCM 20966 / LMG 6465 / NBRC 14845 / NCIMB 13405 / ORS 571) TaxID=438753 RepID=A8I209_AZOC5|nr:MULTISPECIES: malonic semialdehyde reductase [Azorhizobium]TDT91399.1 3-hydroxypropanoate dehydrogenase [Azorhizobium sp. AG788]BAF90684.1 putative NADH dehydrogenase [Azorhizobium caulinodans ORS 571]
MPYKIDQAALDTLFLKARSHNGWTSEPVTDAELKELYELYIYGPTSANTQPARLVFVKSEEAKARLKPALSEGNLKALAAPVIALIGYDLEFYEKIPQLFPHNPGFKDLFTNNPGMVEPHAFRNSSLQGAYFILAARAVGLDVGPMSGFNAAKVDEEFFAGTKIKTNFIAAIGHGDASKVFDRLPRLPFEDGAKIV